MVDIQKAMDSIANEIMTKNNVNSYLPLGITKVNAIKNSDAYADKSGNVKCPAIYYSLDSVEPTRVEQCIAETNIRMNIDVRLVSNNMEQIEKDINGYTSAIINLFGEHTDTSEIWDLVLGEGQVAIDGTANIKIISFDLTGTIRTSL